MNRKVSVMVGCLGVAVLLSACATKGYVREQVGSTETKMGQRVDSTDASSGRRRTGPRPTRKRSNQPVNGSRASMPR